MSTKSASKTALMVGRIVWKAGDLFKGEVDKVFGTQTPKLNQSGQTSNVWAFGLAVQKADAIAFVNMINEEARSIYTNGIPPSFAMKFKDGDGIDHNGQSFAVREGYAGHIIFDLKTHNAPAFYRHENGAYLMINSGIKCGDYVQVQVKMQAHGPIGQGKPGMYLNPSMVLLVGEGKEIINAPSATQVFGNAPPPMPPGAVVQSQQAPQGSQNFMMGQPVQPNYNVLPPQFQQPTQQYQQQPMQQQAPQYQQPAQPQVPQSNVPAGFPFPNQTR